MFSFLRGKFLVGSMIGALALGMAFEADAKRMGGSRSMGKQSSSVTQQQQQRQQAPTQTQQTQQGTQQAAAPTAGAAGTAAATQRRGFMGGMGGILGGLAAGLGIAWLLSQFGLAGAAAQFLANAIIIALIAFAVIWLIRKLRGGSGANARRQEPAYAGMARQAEPQSNPFADQRPQQPAAFQPSATVATAAPAAQQAWGVPADFDTDAFLRNAKVYFVRLQASWDAGNLNDIREFTTPEMFAEIKMDLAERGQTTNQTDVVTLDAELLGIENQADAYLASVRFSGMIRENTGAAAEPFNEVWNLSKPAQGEGGWVLAGIQQVN
ncbi:Tim44 domain-containing protein [Imbroritus primus]|uniref:Tim44 domain-containing protein n=1 Tax=Imbroritus primus TaxID=3058603 RepID=A0ACD3SMA8_9BURK|nr:Tim44 domain-containing protein [Burkholderiaceae bacterium PBA]